MGGGHLGLNRYPLPTAGYPHRLENLENENGHGKVMDNEELAKVMELAKRGILNFALLILN